MSMTNEELFALVKKNPIGFGCLALSLALGAGIYFRGDQVPLASEELTKKSEEGSRLAANLQNAAQLKEQLDAMAVATKELEGRLIHASQTLTNYGYFYKLAGETGVTMTVISQAPPSGPGKGATKTTYNGVPFTITVQGTMHQLVDYLRRLESGARYCRVMTVTCGVPVTDRGNPITLSLNLELLGLP
jgi:hypothetical protein